MDRDKELVINTLNGDMDSFSSLVLGYQERLYNFLLRLTSCREDAEEILQDVFIRVYKYLYKFDLDMSFSTWVYRIAVNTFKDHYKRKKRQCITCSYDGIASIAESFNNRPEAVYERREHFIEIIKIINTLKEDQKIAIILRYIQDFQYKEIAEILGISTENAKMKVSRARKTISESYRKQHGGVLNEM
ncbi:MAG: RNA polymerase sigma factor [Bacillota bacterium]